MLCTLFDTICSASASASADVSPKGGQKVGVGQMEGPLIVTAVAAILCTAMPLDLSQLVFMVIGALAYALLQALQQQPLPVGRGA
eukprot:CAMPEP_0179117124 /NCGR_PEP_ID=MMETSP0796-20121207/54989_1 /TAXON_ID=73915 /ORGANISM="Pyrodinium bahamense, Strain pbaha01" /LENGTH=84 /DNA_ID=CAMNT_0020815467 /DNA_START=91 /DNA_END=342 /DNA_ORIENTATION=-